MPMIYGITPATGGSLTTSGTPGTATETAFVKPGATRTLWLLSLYIIGKANAKTTISGIAMRVKKWTTASTAGTAITPQARDPGYQAATATAASRPTAGSGGGTPVLAFGCGAGGPGGWVAPNQDAWLTMAAANAGSIAIDDVCAEASQTFEFSGEIAE